MWQFGVGLFLVIISPDSLFLTALYGFVMGAAVLILGPLVGDWVDRTPRLSGVFIVLTKTSNMSHCPLGKENI